VILGTAGHIDHGKTTLVKALTGVDTDRLPEEKRRGITIDLGFAPLQLDGIGIVGVVDVPGHEAFVRTMVAGATGIDMALLVIAADEGVMPQTREHVAILEHLGVTRGVVALTKSDMADADWIDLVRGDVVALLAPTGLAHAPIVPVSATTGQGIDDLRAALVQVAKAVPPRKTDDLFRLPIDRVFTVKGTGTVVTGTVWSGELTDGATVRVLPPGRELRVRGLQTHNKSVGRIRAGDRAAIALVGVEVDELSRGSVIVSDPSWEPTRVLRADVVLDDTGKTAIGPRTRVRFHVGTSEVGARLLGGVIPSAARDLHRPSDHHQNTPSHKPSKLILDAPVVLRAGDRFVLRRSSPLETIGGGIVTDPLPPKRAKPWPLALDAKERLRRIVTESAASGIAIDRLAQRLGVWPAAVQDLIGALKTEVVRVGGRLWSAEVPDELRKLIRKLVAEHHRARPLDKGAPVNDLRAKSHVPAELFDSVLHELTSTGKLTNDGGLIRQPGFSAELSGGDDKLAKALLGELAGAGAEPPTAAELAQRHGEKAANVLRFLERSQAVVQVEPGRFYTAESLRAVLDRLKAAMPERREYMPAELREALGTSRKFLIPLLEYCDRQGLTARTETGRTWRR
jgi:selenocysteine-specific elongation factor